MKNKKKSRHKVINLILLMVLMLSFLLQEPMTVCAAENVDIARRCSLRFDIPAAYREDLKTQVLSIRLYHIAEITEYGTYKSIPGYEDLHFEALTTTTTAEELRKLAKDTASYLHITNWEEIPATAPAYEFSITNNEGIQSDMDTGLYLVCVKPAKVGSATYHAMPYLISLPTLIKTENMGVKDLKWVYDLTVDLKLGCERPTPAPTPQPTPPLVPDSSPEPTSIPTPLPSVTPKPSAIPTPTAYPTPYLVEEDGVLWEYFYDENGVLGKRRRNRTGDDSILMLALGGTRTTGVLFALFALLEKRKQRKIQKKEENKEKYLQEKKNGHNPTEWKTFRNIFGLACLAWLIILIIVCIQYYEMRQHNDAIKREVLVGSAEKLEELSTGTSDAVADYCRKNGLPIVNFKALKAVNKDCVAWIYACDGKISYPIVASADEYYLTHAVDGTEAKSGAIYVDSTADNPFLNGRAVIYGHHMRDGSMFQPLMNYWQDRNYQEECRKIYIITEARVYVYEVSNVYVKEYEELDFLMENQDLQDSIIDLVTCEYSGLDTRLVVEAIQKDVQE